MPKSKFVSLPPIELLNSNAFSTVKALNVPIDALIKVSDAQCPEKYNLLAVLSNARV